MTRGFIEGEYQDGEVRGRSFLGGIAGMGKSTEMGRLCNQCAGGALFWDPLAKHAHLLTGGVVAYQPGQLEAYLRVNRAARFRVLYQPNGGDIEAHFRAVCRIVRAFGSMVFCIDEIDMVTGNHYGPSWMPPELYYLVNYGRHPRVAMLATARYPNSVPRGYTSQCISMRLFRNTEPQHIRYFQSYIGSEDAARLSSLPKFHYLYWTGVGVPSQVCTHPM